MGTPGVRLNGGLMAYPAFELQGKTHIALISLLYLGDYGITPLVGWVLTRWG
jgi:hypothetical protein